MDAIDNNPHIRRRFIKVGSRLVHYLRAGHGAPVLLVHSSPANATILLPEIRYLSQRFTCFAFDTPGFGLSDALPLAKMVVADLAAALAKNMRALGLPRCAVYGSHTGAAIALELAARHPSQVAGLVLDGVPIFTEEESARLIKGYFQPMPIDELGGHFSHAWTRFRDQSIWFPWFDRRPENLNPYDLSPPTRTHEWMMMYFHAAKSYMPAYRAAFEYGQEALSAIDGLKMPVVFTATKTDMLHAHLRRLPKLRSGQEVCEIGNSIDRKHLLIAENFERYSSVDCGADAAPIDIHELYASASIERQFFDASHGQIHVRFAGKRSSPHLLLLHDAPGSALFLEPLITALSECYFVCAPDLPGYGESQHFSGTQPAMAEYVTALLEFCHIADLNVTTLYGIGFGSSLAIALANHTPSVAGLVLRGVLLSDKAEKEMLRRNYAPAITIEQDGSHWYRTWLMLRDSQLYWPWYDTRLQSLRRVSGDFSGEHMHQWTFEVMKQHGHYHQFINAAIEYDAAFALAQVKLPTVICNDSSVPLSHYDQKLQSILPDAMRCQISDNNSHATALAQHFGIN